MPTKMTPSKTTVVPFMTGTLLAQPLIARIDRGIRDLEVNFNLKNKLTWSMVRGSNGWTYTLVHVDETKPIVSITNKSLTGLNTFLMNCGKYIAAHYGAAATNSGTTKQRKSA